MLAFPKGCSFFFPRKCYQGEINSCELLTLLEDFILEEISPHIADTIFLYIGPRRKKQFITAGSIYQFDLSTRTWKRIGNNDITFLSTWYDTLEISWGKDSLRLDGRIKKKNWRGIILRAKRLKEIMDDDDDITVALGIRFTPTELVAENCKVVIQTGPGRAVLHGAIVLFSLRDDELKLLIGRDVLYVIDKIKLDRHKIFMDIIYVDTLLEVPMSIRFNWNAEETIERLAKLLNGTPFLDFNVEKNLDTKMVDS